MFKKYFFIINPVAGKGRKLSFIPEIQSFCKKHNLDYEKVLTKEPKEATKIAQRAAKNYEVVVAVGGDGTISEVAGGIYETSAVLGILPTGSGNDFAPMVGISKNLKKALQTLIYGKTRHIDLGKVNSEYIFVNGMGVGFDGETAARVRKFLKYIPGYLGYLLAVLRTLATYKSKSARIKLDGNVIEQEKFFLIATCNGTQYGGGFRVAPSAKIDDGLFTVCVVDQVSHLYALRNLPKFTKGVHIKLPEVHTLTAKKVTIESEDNLQAQLDGELLPLMKTFEIEILPGKLAVLSN
ncbi:diacylglycerol kinase family lipid kinase [Patescibacteria group bacterium]|nr:diacylglycerol kinase family lipid kinase [Patescibacteria group bacterium]